jgi:glutamyl/glutaminyl-tRNA synthetase
MVRVRFAPSPSGSLHLGSALTAVASRRFADENGGSLLLLIADADAAEAIADLEWLAISWDEGPVLESERFVRHREAAHLIGEPDGEGALCFGPTVLLRADGTVTAQLASAVDAADFGITHVIEGSDRSANADLEAALIRALGAEPPEFVHHGQLLGAPSLADLREDGLPPEAVRAYLDELGLPRSDVHFDLGRLRRRSIEAIAALTDDELAARVGVPVSVAPVLRSARDLREARTYALQVLEPGRVPVNAPETLERFRELVEGGLDARSVVRELQAVGGDLESLRLALTGHERGPELAAVIAALPREELLRRASGMADR